MWNPPTHSDLESMPPLYSSEDTPPEETMIHMHFFLGSCDWYAAEYGDADRLFFGYVILNNDFQNSEWGYFALDELSELRIRGVLEVDRDLHWKSTRAYDVPRIREAHGWR